MSIENSEKKNPSEFQELTQPTENASKDAVIGKQTQQQRWNQMNDFHRLEQEESATDLFYKPQERSQNTNKFGIDGLEDDIQQIAYNSENLKTDQKHALNKTITAEKLSEHTHQLGENNPKMWANEGPHGEIRKCNLFADKVFRDSKIPLPWDTKNIPAVKDMIKLLSSSPNWEIAYTDQMPLGNYNPKPGDLAMWAKDTWHQYKAQNGQLLKQHYHLEHCGIIGIDNEIMYAGSGQRNGYAESDFNLMVKAPTYGPPTIIFRSKHLH